MIEIIRGPLRGLVLPEGSPSEVGVFVPVTAIFPGADADERTLLQLLSDLSRDDTLFHCAKINTIISGPGDNEMLSRQQQVTNAYCTGDQVDRINAFIKREAVNSPPAIFFRGQLLELMRWVSRHCANHPNDGNTFADPAVRERFVKAALIASMLWSNRTYGDRLSADGDVAETRILALGALRKGVEETGVAPHIGMALGRGLKLFGEYLPAQCPEFLKIFEQTTGLTIRDYLASASIFIPRMMQRAPEGQIFVSQAFSAPAFRGIVPRFISLESQTPEELATSFWDNFET